MNQQTLQVTIGCLLHDIGKLCFRAGDSGRHSESGYRFLKEIWKEYPFGAIPDCLRWHHSAEIREAQPPKDSIAYIAWIADNISASADRRTVEETGSFDRYLPLSPVFSHLNGEHPHKSLSPQQQDSTLRMPSEGQIALTQGDYENICRELKQRLSSLPPEEQWVNSLLSVLETFTGNVPSSTNTGESPDVSLFDHTKISAAAGACISEVLISRGITDFRNALFTQESSFRAEKVFLLYSADFSGIQKFISTVATKNALRSLRSRSFFLEMAMEHYIDELLMVCGLSRANLLYSGGGHCYILLPNTDSVKEKIGRWNLTFNSWLLKQFGTSLYLADGYTECSADELTNTPAEDAPYKEIFHRVSSALSKKKLHRYSAQQIIDMNRMESDLSGRECRVCGRTDELVRAEDGGELCVWCSVFEKISSKIQKSTVFLISNESAADADFILPSTDGTVSFVMTDVEKARSLLKDSADSSGNADSVRRVYTKNKAYMGLRYSTRIYVGDYAASNSLADLAEQSEGIRRLAVCRMDVDNLGQAFVSGFEKTEEKDITARQHFVTISRTAAFSRQMSLFFKLYINSLLNGEYDKREPLNVTIVYSGGDDIYLVGSWNDAVSAALKIRNALRHFSCGSLTISGGIGVFDDHYPIRNAGAETADQEDEAKAMPGKDAVSLFAAGAGCTYHWDDLQNNVLNEKLAELDRFFDADKTNHGMAFLYRILELLRQTQSDSAQKMPLARLAYMISRLEPLRSSPVYSHYAEFSNKIFAWSLNSDDRRALITAIYLYVYRNRKEVMTDVQ